MLKRFINTLLYTVFIGSLLLVSLPAMCVISIVLFLACGRPILYVQRRVGKNNDVFVLYKFRTMVHDAEVQKFRFSHLNEAKGPAFKIRNDPRFTPLGKFLSHTGFDELPQLINVIRGEMALLGPRPLPVEEAKKLLPWMQERHTIKPGIISPWILNGYHSKSFNEWMRSDIDYTLNKNLSYDIVLTARAVTFMIRLYIRELVSLATSLPQNSSVMNSGRTERLLQRAKKK